MKQKRSAWQQRWIEAHPIRRSTHTGFYGYERSGDCVNLERMVYKTVKAAEMARAADAAVWESLDVYLRIAP